MEHIVSFVIQVGLFTKEALLGIGIVTEAVSQFFQTVLF